MPWLSLIIPTRGLDAELCRRIERLQRQLPGAEVLVVEPGDGGETPMRQRVPWVCDAARERRLGLHRLTGVRGRGTQCNAGARAARGEILLFLHDDTELPEDADGWIKQSFVDPATEIACFRLRFDRRHPLLALYAWFSRFDSYLTSFGDQGILIRRALFDGLGGFPDWPVFEDVELLKRARRRTRIRKLPVAVTTSAVRYTENGILRQQLLNASLMLRFAAGAAPESLRARYERRRSGHRDADRAPPQSERS